MEKNGIGKESILRSIIELRKAYIRNYGKNPEIIKMGKSVYKKLSEEFKEKEIQPVLMHSIYDIPIGRVCGMDIFIDDRLGESIEMKRYIRRLTL